MSDKAKKTKTDTKGKADAPVRKSNLPERPSYKYDVTALADTLGIEPASVRVALRKHKVDKAEGNVYGWNNKTDFEAVVAKLKSDKKADSTKKAPEPAKKPAKKAA